MNNMPPHSPPHSTMNVAGNGASVGIQAATVHNANVYNVSASDTPQRKHEVGLRYLEDGIPVKAIELIDNAIASGLDDAEVRFHWALAMLSKRSYRDLDPGERARLDEFASRRHHYPDGEFKAALDAVSTLLRVVNGSSGDHAAVDERILTLPPNPRAMIDRHLDLVLSGATRDKLWRESLRQANHDRFGNDRRDRMWAYFHPRPSSPPTIVPRRISLDELDRFRAVTATVGFALSSGYLGWLVVSGLDVVGILAFLVAVAAGFTGLPAAFDWRYRLRRINGEFAGHRYADNTGRTSKLGHAFQFYFRRYRPKNMDPDLWSDLTAGVRAHLRAKVTDTYSHRHIAVDRMNWLVRFLAQQITRRWETTGTIYEYPRRYRVDQATKVKCVPLALVPFAVVLVCAAALPVAPFYTVVAVVAAVATGSYAALRWEHIEAEKRRFDDDRAEADQDNHVWEAEYRRWKAKLDGIRPSEHEMATWLHCDKTVLIDEALSHYRLSWREVISFAILQGPLKGRKRAREQGGPWRFSRYDLRLFLITEDGVREVISALDFERSVFEGKERNNFRFDALSSVNVTERTDSSRVLKLTLTNGPTRNIRIIDAAETGDGSPETATDQVAMDLDTSGFTHALRLLEGIAAEGKRWIKRDIVIPSPRTAPDGRTSPAAGDG